MYLSDISRVVMLLMIARGAFCEFNGLVVVLPQSYTGPLLEAFVSPNLHQFDDYSDNDVERLLAEAIQSHRRQKTTLNPHAWVEEAPGTVKSEPVYYPPNQLSLDLHKLLDIKKKMEDKAKGNLG